jgi:hypothetical protein
MTRWLALVGFELRYYLKRISTWVYFAVMFGIAFLLTNMIGGAFESVNAAVGGTDGKVLTNSPFVLTLLTWQVSLFGILITAALAGHAGYRDFGARMHALAFTTPVGKWTWLSARFAGTLLINLVVLSGIGFGLWTGSLVPWVDAEYFGPNVLAEYVAPYLTIVLPNLLFTAAIFFSLAALTRARLPHYAGGVILLMGYILASVLAGDVENKTLAALADPFGIQAVSLHTEYWTTVEKNARIIPLEGLVLQNRLLWLGVTVVIALLAARLFGFRQEAFPGRRGTAAPRLDLSPAAPLAPTELILPEATQLSGFGATFAQFRTILRRAFRDVVMNVYFVAILFAAMNFLTFGATQVGKLFGTTTYPVTYQVLEVLGGLFGLFVLIVITFYAGELVWHERDIKVNQIVDATPAPNWVTYLAKGSALAAIVAALLAVLGLAGMATQLARGYTNIEPMVYLEYLYGYQFVDYLLLCVLALAIHSIVNHKHVGHLLMVLFFGFNAFRGQMGLDHVLYGYGSDLGSTYSDMNKFGWYSAPFVLFKLYWGGVALLLAVLSNVFWVRGQETGANWRLSLARLRFRSPALAASLIGGAVALGFGGLIFWNTNVRNEYLTQHESQQRTARYEREFKQYEGLPQPRIQAVKLEVDLFPETGDGATRGSYQLENRSGGPIETIHLQINANAEINELDIDLPHELELEDAELGYRIWRLAEPWPAGAKAELSFDFFFSRRGFSNSGVQNQVVENGSFVSSGAVLPSFGYNPSGELSTDKVRKKHGFLPKERMRDLDDPEGVLNTYISDDADFVDFEVVVSTSPDQIAISPGYLQREWEENGRRYFHYEMDAPILNFFSFLSARYEVQRDSWNDVAIEVYYHPGHEYNVQRMIDAVKHSLDYYSREFSPYQHRQVRILEFPRYASFAQAFPNTIPYSEAIGFIAKVDGEDIDYPTYVTAHEIAHQWWAHQVIGAEVQGATVLSETLSQYSALMVMEELYGQAKIADFLAYELDSYLQGRSLEGKKELPLLRVENQQYIHYRKGSLVMYATKELIGEQAVNQALRDLIEEFGFKGPPYPTSRDLLKHLRAQAPDEHQDALTDLFEKITIYDNKAVAATYERIGTGEYEVTLTYEAKKLHAGELGEEAEVPLRDWMHVAAWAKKGDDEPIYLEKHLVTENEGEIRFTVSQPPARVGLDPLHVLVDRHPDDNVVDTERAEGAESADS